MIFENGATEKYLYILKKDIYSMVDSIFVYGRKWRKERGILIMIVIFTGVICTGCIPQEEEPQGAEAPYPEDYFRGDFVVTGEPVLNQEVEIIFSVNPPIDSLNTEIRIFLQEGIELVQGNLHWEGDIKKDEVVEVTIIVKPVQEGQLDINVYVKGMLGGKHEKDREHFLVFLTAKDSGQVSRTHFYPPPLEGRAIELTVGLVIKVPNFLDIGEEAVVTFSLLASKDVSDVRAVIVLPEELILIDGVLEWTGDLKKEKEETFQITIIPTERGRFEILGILTYDDEEWKFARHVFVD